jgi:hypothetical protein
LDDILGEMKKQQQQKMICDGLDTQRKWYEKDRDREYHNGNKREHETREDTKEDGCTK